MVDRPTSLPVSESVDHGVLIPLDVYFDLWTERVGRTSATTGFRVCARDGSTTYAHGTRTIVNLGGETMRPTEWFEDHRAGFDRIQGPEA